MFWLLKARIGVLLEKASVRQVLSFTRKSCSTSAPSNWERLVTSRYYYHKRLHICLWFRCYVGKHVQHSISSSETDVYQERTTILATRAKHAATRGKLGRESPLMPEAEKRCRLRRVYLLLCKADAVVCLEFHTYLWGWFPKWSGERPVGTDISK